MKLRLANNKALTKARPASGKIMHAPRAQLAGSKLSPHRGDISLDAIVVSAIRQFSTHCVEIVSALRTQFDESKIVQTLTAQSGWSHFKEIVAALRRQSESEFLSLAPGFSQVSGASEIQKPFQRFLYAGNKPLKRFARHVVVNTRLKPGANERARRASPNYLRGTTALTPALSPRRGRIVRRSFECCESAVARCASGKPEIAKRCSLSPGERVRVRASVKTNFMERDGIHVASYVTKLIPKKQLERKLHQAVRLARARLRNQKQND